MRVVTMTAEEAPTDATSSPTPAHRRRPGFRVRVVGLMAVLLVGAGSLGLFVQRAVLLSRLDQEVEESLHQERQELIRLSTGSDPQTGEPFAGDVVAIFDTFLRQNVPGEGEVYLTIVDGAPYRATPPPDGVRLAEDPEIMNRWPELVEELMDRWADSDEGESGRIDTIAGPADYLTIPFRSEDRTAGVFIVANFLRHERDEIEEGIRVEALVSAFVLLAALGAAWVVAGRLLRPVRRLTDTARTITETDLSGRIPIDTDDEIGHLAVTFNDMLDRLDSAFSTQRRFIEDAGHELRTPITVVRGQLEVMGDDPDEQRATIALVTDELDRMARIVNDLLLLAKAEQPQFLHIESVELSDLTTELFMKARQLGERNWQLVACGEGTVSCDPQRITQAVLNLARNAVEHTEPGETIEIASAIDGPRFELTVRDTGSGIAPANSGRIFERFARGPTPTRSTEGAGLGLSIVRAVVDAHRGTVDVANAPEGGAEFTITLPTLHGPPARPSNFQPHRATAREHR